jgi:hypothetical protein
MAESVKSEIIGELTDDKAAAVGGRPTGPRGAVFRQMIPEIIWTGRAGDQHFRMGDGYSVTAVRIEQTLDSEFCGER